MNNEDDDLDRAEETDDTDVDVGLFNSNPYGELDNVDGLAMVSRARRLPSRDSELLSNSSMPDFDAALDEYISWSYSGQTEDEDILNGENNRIADIQTHSVKSRTGHQVRANHGDGLGSGRDLALRQNLAQFIEVAAFGTLSNSQSAGNATSVERSSSQKGQSKRERENDDRDDGADDGCENRCEVVTEPVDKQQGSYMPCPCCNDIDGGCPGFDPNRSTLMYCF